MLQQARRLRCGWSLALLAVVCGMATANRATAAEPGVEGPQVIEGDVLRDLDFAFEIRLPSDDWEFWDENEVRQVNAAACAGMADLKNQCFLAVLAERSPKTDLAAYAKLLLSAMPLKRGSEPEEQPLKLAGEPALKIKVSANTQELVFRYLLYLVEHNLKHDDYHRLLLKQMQAAPDTQVGRRPLGGLELRVSRFDRQLSGLDLTCVLITAVRDRRHVQLLIYGLRSSLTGIDERLNDIVAGLKLPDRPETPRLDAADALTDVRLGFCLSSGNSGGRLKWMPQGQIDAIGSQAMLELGELSCLAQGICSVDAFAAGLAVKGILKELAGRGFDLTTRQDLDDVLDGLSAKQIFVEKRAGPRMLASIWIARRANTQYLFSATEQAPAGQGDALTMREHKQYFSLVDWSLIPINLTYLVDPWL